MLWHYTTGRLVRLIVASGELRPTDIRIDKGERPAVWFSSETLFEPTARKAIMGGGTVRIASPEEMHEMDGGFFRFGVAPETVPVDWREFGRVSGISSKMYRALAKTASEQGANPRNWRCSFEPIPRSLWLAVEQMEFPVRKWRPVPEEQLDAMAAK